MMNNQRNDMDTLSKVLYSDALVEISEESILFYNYYFPTGNKRVRLDQISKIKILESTIWTGKWRLAGTGDFRTWFPTDYDRPSRDKIFILLLKNKWRRIGFTVENSTAAAKIFIDKGLLIEQDLERKYSMQNTTNSGDKTWGNIKEGYLYQVEKSLMKVKHTSKKQVLEDVSSHLDQKFAELGEDDKVWENYQQIITEMGPAEDYAELLGGETPQVNSKSGKWFLYFIIFDFIALMLVLGFIVIPNRSCKRSGESQKTSYIETAAIIMSFEGKGDFKPKTAKELLDGFNGELNFRVQTHYFQTEAIGDKLIGHICTDTEDDKNAILKCLYNSKIITVVGIEEIDKEEFEEYKQLDQPGLKNTSVRNTIAAEQGTKEAVGSAYTWLELIDNGEYGESWAEAASIFKANVSKAQWEKALENIYTPLGKVIDREVISQIPTETVPGGPDGDYLIIQFRTEFENKKDAIETVTPMLEKDGQWRVSGYFIK
jgi:hypothetical protein